MIKRKKLITFEGCEGSGKSSVIESLGNIPRFKNLYVTKEPGATIAGRAIRQIVLDIEMNYRTEFLLYCADRADHIEKVLNPLFKKNRDSVVLCDRYSDSTLAYQSNDFFTMPEIIHLMHTVIPDYIIPYHTFLFDGDPAVFLKRKDSASFNKFENRSIAFHRNVRANFLLIAKMFPERFSILNSEKINLKTLTELVGYKLDELISE